MTIILAILVFCALIIIHEMGHFFAAKACGIQVNQFALGMGPTIFKIKGKETLYVIKLFPIGGSVSMEGEDESSDNPRAFNRKPIWQRMIVILAGAVMNLILGFVVVVISLAVSQHNLGSLTISSFRENPVSSNTLQVGDEIKKINGMNIYSTMDISYQFTNSQQNVNENNNIVFSFEVIRNGERVKLDNVEFDTQLAENADEKAKIYLDFYVSPLEKNFFNVISNGWGETVSIARLIWISLIDLVKGTYGLNELSGPIGVVNVIGESAKLGLSSLLSIVSMITINLGIFNLLPFPALDGCRALFLIIEAIRKKPMKPEHEGMIHFAGLMLLFLLMIVVAFNDIMRLINGG